MNHSTLAIIGTFIGMIVCLWRIASWYQSKVDDTVSKIFKRFDEHKDGIDKKLFYLQDMNNKSFVRKDTCTLQTGVFKEMFGEIKDSIKSVENKIDTYMLNGKKTDG